MHVPTLILSSLIALFVNTTPVVALPTSNAASEEVYTPMRWTGSVVKGGPVMELEGTLSEILPKIIELNPDWQPPLEVLAGLRAPIKSLVTGPVKDVVKGLLPTKTTSSNPSLVERYFKNRPTCNTVPGYLAEGWLIQGRGIPMLEGLSEAGIMCGVAPHSCAKCYCEEGSRIELCNDRNTFLNIECKRLAGAAGEIVKQCAEFIAGDYRMRGQWFDTTSYSAVVRRSYDNTC